MSSFIRAIECKAIAFFFMKVLDGKKIKEVAEKVGKQIDELLDQRYKEKRSEKIQEKLIEVVIKFSDALIRKLQEDWPTKGGK